jgi:hypothetical protein
MGIADDILKVRIAGRPSQTLYLNNDRVNEQFVSQLDTISEWLRHNNANAQSEVNVSGTGDGAGTLGSQPLARALAVREALQWIGAVRSPAEADVGQYVISTGRSCLRHPQLEANYPPGLKPHDDNCIPVDDPRYQSLELDRARAEAVRFALGGGAAQVNDRMWLLTLTEGSDISSAAVLNSLWINDAVISYLHDPWTMFGVYRERVSDVPLIAAIHVWVKM